MNKEKDMSKLLDKLNDLFNEYGFSIYSLYRKPTLDFIRNEIIYIEVLPTDLNEMLKEVENGQSDCGSDRSDA